ncbi:MAG: DNA mismatch repair endonuclease MutL [Clostridia bacterium]|nr:DNA mismatch repair endonuclease MutL [Clostridia bacterium]
MGRINVLSFEIANLIAAGEVVERPSSVLKELIENSIDAGATSIVAEIKRGGVSLIRVTDNGVGIDKEDLPVAIKRHATSKISSREDLDGIATLGFRGEALAAIASVSKLTIITKTAAADTASMLVSEAGVVTDVSEVGAADGTTVVVTDLFYNVPARRKFLKKDATEAMSVTALVEKVALSRPDISIQLLIDGEERFKTPGDGNIENTVYAVFGRDFAKKMISVSGKAGAIRVHGLIGRSDNVKKNRNYMNAFINGRYVKSQTVNVAVEKAYTSYIAPEAFPVCVLFIEMGHGYVDVNVHPAKLEVKFSDERAVFEAVYYTVRNALTEHEYRPEMELSRQKPTPNYLGAFMPIGETKRAEQIKIESAPTQRPEPTARPRESAPKDEILTVASGAGSINSRRDRSGSPAPHLTPRDSRELLERYADSVRISASDAVKEEEKEAPSTPSYRYIGEAFDCYVIIEYEGALLVIDKHAAHERVIFEQLKSSRNADGRIGSQTLMLPITPALTPDEYASAVEYRDELLSVGFDFTAEGGVCDITAIPDAISIADAEGLFVSMTDELALGTGNPANTEAQRREKALYQIACKAAIKGGRVYDRSIIDWLITRLLSLPDITVCPHGRPVAFRLTKSELDRQFERLK